VTVAQNTVTPAMLRARIVGSEQTPRLGLSAADSEIILRLGGHVGSEIECYSVLGRAMEQARAHIRMAEQAGRTAAGGTVILADCLAGSKGRFTRNWHAPIGGIWGCLLLPDGLLDRARMLLPLTLGMACCEMVREQGISQAAVRWVNDVLVDGRKLAGFLVEGYRAPLSGENWFLLGFGINVNNTTFPAELSASAVSLSQLLGRSLDLPALTASFLARLAWNIGLLLYQEQQDLMVLPDDSGPACHLVLDRWRSLSDTLGRRVLYGYNVEQQPQYRARVVDIRPDGALVMRLDDGHCLTEYSGEVRYC
jgi:BirA family transcriptional regulator, biotin operon repressor / biotin---[acetyl-CoA-carboxylase] ligase